MKALQGTLNANNTRFAIIISRFNELITKNLLSGAVDGLKRHGVDEHMISLIWVPGSLEIPLVAKKIARSGQYDALICIGVIIRGATAHFDLVAQQTFSGIKEVALSHEIPVIPAVLAVDTIEQAMERSGIKMGNRGYDAALVAIEMANLLKQL